ncbi:MAG: hypothetical protein ACYSUK_05470 [Planctomycetota bacterium]|jgi:hypothetical protein
MFGKKTWAEVGRGEERKGGKTPAHSSLFIIADIHFFNQQDRGGREERVFNLSPILSSLFTFTFPTNLGSLILKDYYLSPLTKTAQL